MTFSFCLIFDVTVWPRMDKLIIFQTFIMVRKISFQNLQKLYFKIASIEILTMHIVSSAYS